MFSSFKFYGELKLYYLLSGNRAIRLSILNREKENEEEEIYGRRKTKKKNEIYISNIIDTAKNEDITFHSLKEVIYH